MEHWFDRLAQPHTRRTALKTAALGGAALLLPFGRLARAGAFTAEPCYSACLEGGITGAGAGAGGGCTNTCGTGEGAGCADART